MKPEVLKAIKLNGMLVDDSVYKLFQIANSDKVIVLLNKKHHEGSKLLRSKDISLADIIELLNYDTQQTGCILQ